MHFKNLPPLPENFFLRPTVHTYPSLEAHSLRINSENVIWPSWSTSASSNRFISPRTKLSRLLSTDELLLPLPRGQTSTLQSMRGVNRVICTLVNKWTKSVTRPNKEKDGEKAQIKWSLFLSSVSRETFLKSYSVVFSPWRFVQSPSKEKSCEILLSIFYYFSHLVPSMFLWWLSDADGGHIFISVQEYLRKSCMLHVTN